MNADGSDPVQITSTPDGDAAWSPDGSQIVFTSYRDAGDPEIYLMNSDGSDQTRLTKSTGADNLAAWSPDGKKIAFMSERTGRFEIYTIGADGTGLRRLVFSDNVLFGEDLVDESMLNVDPSGVAPGEVTDELLVSRRCGERVVGEHVEQLLGSLLQS